MVLRSGQYTVRDLNNELYRRLHEKATDKELERLDEIRVNRERQKTFNRGIGYQKRALNYKLKKEGPSLSKQDYKRRVSEIDKLNKMKFDLSIIDNEANRILKKDFHYLVNDGFSERPFKVKVSTLLKKENPAEFLLRKFQRSLDKKILKAESDFNITDKQFEGLKKLSEKVNNSVESLQMEEDIDEEDMYILTVEFFGDILDLNF